MYRGVLRHVGFATGALNWGTDWIVGRARRLGHGRPA